MTISISTLKKPGLKGLLLGGTWALLIAPLVFSLVSRAAITSIPNGPNVLYPVLNVGQVSPLAMLLLSRDDQLFFRAFSDYSDLNGDGTVDTTYTDSFDYAGYFDPKLCYSYSSNEFAAASSATGTNNHACDGSHWSGNFLNWLTMTRLDEERFVLYGGRRVVDTATETVLQRAFVPNDAHAWVKVYSGSDINSFTPYTGTMSFCNATMGVVGKDSSADTTSMPLLRAAAGSWPTWATSERTQCQIRNTASASGAGTNNLSLASYPQTSDLKADYDVRVKVCDSTAAVMESFCKTIATYVDDDGVVHYKPTGLLQKFGTSIRFGLMTGTWQHPRSGGVLRRNIGFIQGNGDGSCTATGNEIDPKTGQFCYIEESTPAMAGIINSIDNFRVYGWNPNASNDESYSDCGTYGIQNRQGTGTTSNKHLSNPGSTTASNGYSCSEWGNPLGEMYAEALRYIEHFDSDKKTALSATTAFTVADNKDLVPNMPAPSWTDPYSEKDGDGGAAYCAQCNIVVLSTGLNTFDGDSETPTVPDLAKQAYAATTDVGTDEITGNGSSSKQFLVGQLASSTAELAIGAATDPDTSQDVCDQQTIDDLGLVRGICPDVPGAEGSYYLAGLAYEGWTNDMRPDLTKPSDFKNTVETYAVQLSESLPSFDVGVRTSASEVDTVTVLPGCQAQDTQASTQPAPFRACGLMNVQVGPITNPDTGITYGLPYHPDFTVGQTNGGSYGSFTISWMDSAYGADYDVDAVQVITFCVGDACYLSNVQQYMCKQQNSKDPVGKNGSSSTICSGGKIKQGNVQASQVLVRTESVYNSTYMPMNLGYTVAGPDNAANGFYQGVQATGNGNLLTGTGSGTSATNAIAPSGWGTPNIQKFSTGPSQQSLLPNPLYLAAKYGGFQDSNGNGIPDVQSEWDSKNNSTGASGSDGEPDNYFLVRDPSTLITALNNTFSSILARSGSGTAAAVVANSINGQGVVYKATYEPTLTDLDGNSVAWTGSLNTVWVDSYGLLREDNNANAKLDDYGTDKILIYTTDASDKPEFKECTPNDVTTFDPSKFSPDGSDLSQVSCVLHTDMDDLATVWDAKKQLWSDSDTFAATQRTYSSAASGGRYISTWVDGNHNGVVDSGEQTEFVWEGDTGTQGFYGSVTTTNSQGVKTTSPKGNLGFLNTDDPTEAECIVNWIRGVESNSTNDCGLRNRTIEVASDSNNKHVFRLGDIVNSTPLVVGKPAEAYDQLYGDNSYAAFRAQYRDRRQMVYVGANDGMLHAFNGGFYDAANHQLDLQPQKCTTTDGKTTCSADTSFTAHPLGSEVWAYVPGDLLPQLRWLAAADYAHGFYVDGSPIATDAKIFNNDSDCSKVTTGMCHPGGWGTVLVVPFRLGGGATGGQADTKVPVAIDTGKSYDPASCDGTSATNCIYEESYSSYVVLDVTDPEKAPVLLAELHPASDDSNGSSFTTSEPAFAVIRNPSSGTPDKFYMFIGSGPTLATQEQVTSTKPLRLYAYDLAALACQAGDAGTCTGATGSPLKSFDLSNSGAVSQGMNSFAGDLIASDFDLDDQAEAVYFGSVRDDQTSTPREYTGSLWKLTLGVDATTKKAAGESTDSSTWATSLIYDVKKPIVIRPTLGLNLRLAPEIYAATGRVLDSTDISTTGQQQIFGVIDPNLLPSGDAQSDFTLPFGSGDLLDVTNIDVCAAVVTDGCTETGGLINGPTGAGNFTDLEQLFDTSKADKGYAGFVRKLTSSTSSAAQRVVSAQTLLGGVLITNAYTPDTNTCTDLGTGQEFSLNFITGTGDPSSTKFGTNDNGTVIVSKSLGAGLPSPPSLHVSAGSDASFSSVTACTQTSTGAIICQPVTTLFPVRSSEISWREPLDQ